jgi:aminomethyltransferase
LGAPVPDNAWQAIAWGARWVLRERVWRIIAPAADRALLTAGIMEADAAAVHAVRLERGTPRYGEDITEANIAHETGLLEAIHFSKGCYIGQEIVERVRARGHVNRQLVHLRIAAAAAPAPGTPLLADGKETGAITSAAWSPADGAAYALGYVRAEHAAPATALTADGHAAAVLAR